MKKTLLIAGLLVAASTAQAQTPYYYQYGPRYGALPADGTTEGLPGMDLGGRDFGKLVLLDHFLAHVFRLSGHEREGTEKEGAE